MAADILVYRATHVPVGEDQKQHLELSRDIAQKFNNDFAASIAAQGFGDAFFPLPEPLIRGPATRVMSLRDGAKKMSKSDASDYSRINLTDDADAIAQKIRKREDRSRAAAERGKGFGQPRLRPTTCVGIYAALADTDAAGVLREFGGAQFSTFKTALIDIAVAQTRPDRGRDEAADAGSGRHRCGVRRRRRTRARDRGRDHERGQGYRRFSPLKPHSFDEALAARLVPAGLPRQFDLCIA